MAGRDDYALRTKKAAEAEAPDLPYRPPRPKGRHGVALVGAGGISAAHLDAYRGMGMPVVAICDHTLSKAEARRDEFFPEATATTDFDALLARGDIDVLDLTPHPEHRLPLIERGLLAGKHVLSQKPFVTDLDEGERLCRLAEERGLRLAVNQNGRWSPHMAWMRAAVERGLLGKVMAVHLGIHWDHRWVRGTPFERIRDLVLYDFGIHWFDFVASLMRRPARSVQALVARPASAGIAPPMLASAIIDFGNGQASLVLDAATPFGPLDSTYVAGSTGSLVSRGPDLGRQQVELWTEAGVARPRLDGQWFNDGFAGAMGELLLAIEEGRDPSHAARSNLDSLALCFAAIASARDGRPIKPGAVRRLPAQAM